jgi:hypothetical protein
MNVLSAVGEFEESLKDRRLALARGILRVQQGDYDERGTD